MKLYLLMLFFIGFQCSMLQAQNQTISTSTAKESKVKVAAYDGMVLAGYVDEGAFLNFTGPNIQWNENYSKIMLGMLPSLRIKEDHSEPKNSTVIPSLGIGLTYSYKKLAIQLPLYYNAKTAVTDGQWNLGIGFGIRLKT